MSDSEMDRLRREVERLEAELDSAADTATTQLNVRIPVSLKGRIASLSEGRGIGDFVIAALTEYAEKVEQQQKNVNPGLFDLP